MQLQYLEMSMTIAYNYCKKLNEVIIFISCAQTSGRVCMWSIDSKYYLLYYITKQLVLQKMYNFNGTAIKMCLQLKTGIFYHIFLL